MVVMRLLISPGIWSLYALSEAGLRVEGLGGWRVEIDGLGGWRVVMGLRGLEPGAPVLAVLVTMGLSGFGFAARPRGGSRVAGGEARVAGGEKRGLDTAMVGGCGGGGAVEVVGRDRSVTDGLVFVRRRGWMCACAGSTGDVFPSRMDAFAMVWMLDVDTAAGGSFGRWEKENCLPRLGGRLPWPEPGREDESSGEIWGE